MARMPISLQVSELFQVAREVNEDQIQKSLTVRVESCGVRLLRWKLIAIYVSCRRGFCCMEYRPGLS